MCISISKSKSCYVYCHLGNIRHVDKAAPDNRGHEIVQVNNYYPYGSMLNDVADGAYVVAGKNRTGIQTHKYNGKEFDTMHGLNLYDYSARQYDPTLGQFTSMDPLCEKYYHISPYVYCAGNPVKFVDPDGKKVYLYATTLPADKDYEKLGGYPTHTFITIENSDGKTIKYAAYGPEEGNPLMGMDRLSQCHYQQDIDIIQGKDKVNLKNKIPVPVPDEMTSEEFDKKVSSVIDSFGNEDGIRYNILPVGETQGNCNSSSSTILLKSGVTKESLNNIKEQIPGIKTGFDSVAKPWTSEEQKEAIKNKYKFYEERPE